MTDEQLAQFQGAFMDELMKRIIEELETNQTAQENKPCNCLNGSIPIPCRDGKPRCVVFHRKPCPNCERGKEEARRVEAFEKGKKP